MTWMELELQHASGLIKKRGLTLVKGEGATVWSDEGRSYIDCVAGLGTATLGHGNPAVASAIASQAASLIVCTESFGNDQRAAFMDRLCRILPPALDKVYLCNSGAEANEAALKFARIATGRTGFVSTVRGFHGRTMGALSVTHEPKYRTPFEPLVPGAKFIPYNKVEALEEAVNEETAALILEPVQGEAGLYPASHEYLEAAREVTRRKGALLIIDEVQGGFARSGRWFSHQHSGIEPDIVTMAKALAAGVPMGAVAFGPAVTGLQPGMHGTTFGGNPLACAAGLASLKELERIDAPRLCAEKGEWLLESLRGLDLPVVREVRGLGLWIGLELKIKVAPVIAALQEKGLLCPPSGMTVVRFLPPAVITQAQLEQTVSIVREVLSDPPGGA